MVKNPPAMQETIIRSLVQRFPWRREWLPTSVFLPEEFHGQRSLVGYRPWGLGHDGMTNTFFTLKAIVLQLKINLKNKQKSLNARNRKHCSGLVTRSGLILQLHGWQDARLPCPSPSPRARSNSCPESVMPPDHLILSSPCLSALNLSQCQGLF